MATPAGTPNHAAPGISQFLVQVYGEEREALLDYAAELWDRGPTFHT